MKQPCDKEKHFLAIKTLNLMVSKRNSKQINLFIAQNTAGLVSMECVIRQNAAFCENFNVIINLTPGIPKPDIWSLVIKVNCKIFEGRDVSRVSAVLNQIQKAVFTKAMVKQIEFCFKSKMHRPRLFYQNLLNPLVNTLYFSKRIVWGEQFIVEEGLANYYEYFDVNRRAQIKFRVKQMFFLAFGLRLKKINTLTGIDEESTIAQYVYCPEYTTHPNKSRVIARSHAVYKPNSNVVFIIGQEAGLRGADLDQYCNVINNILFEVRKLLRAPKILYKPHWDTDNNVENKLKGIVLMIRDRGRAEDIVKRIKPSFIISLASSALVNIALEYKNMVEQGELKIYYNRTFNPSIEIVRLFDKVGVRHLDLHQAA